MRITRLHRTLASTGVLHASTPYWHRTPYTHCFLHSVLLAGADLEPVTDRSVQTTTRASQRLRGAPTDAADTLPVTLYCSADAFPVSMLRNSEIPVEVVRVLPPLRQPGLPQTGAGATGARVPSLRLRQSGPLTTRRIQVDLPACQALPEEA